MLRDYQQRIIDKTIQVVRSGKRKPVIVAGTGSGKTHIATDLVLRAIAKGSKVLFLAPRRELIYQTLEKFVSHGIDAGMIMAGEMPNIMARVQVASFDTLHARAMRRDKMEMPDADVLIVDEAHLSMSKSKLAIMNHYKDAVVIGLTATPARSDGTGLGEFYDAMVNEVSVKELIEQGHLCPARYFAPTVFDLEGVKSTKSDYVIDSLEKAIDKPELIGDIVDNWQLIAPTRQTIVFCVTRNHARHVCNEFIERGIVAEYVDGETDNGDRMDILHRFKENEIQVIVNVFVYTYGLDAPCASCIVIARPTKNIATYIQCAGRGLRTYEGKDDCIIIDHSGVVELHGFVDDPIPWSLDGTDVRENKKKQDEEQKKPKEMKCKQCKTVYSGQRACPMCGFESIPRGEPLPVYEAELKEVKKTAEMTNEQKALFYGMLKQYGREHGFAPGWASNKYRNKVGVWPNAYSRVPEVKPSEKVLNWITSQFIAYSHRNKKIQQAENRV